jgi:hypothetical protein
MSITNENPMGDLCPHCEGTGREVPDCPECEGKGWVDDPEDGGTMKCPDCENEECAQCEGTGHL